MKIHAAAVSHVGLIRENNEDNFCLQGQIREHLDDLYSSTHGSYGEEPLVFAVADGMGGMAHGELASLTAVQALVPCTFAEVRETARASIDSANMDICRAQSRVSRTMGTTLAALYMADGQAMACNIGDSRIYLYRGGALRQLSVDHNRAQELLDLGLITPKEARHHAGRHALTQFIGIPPEEMVISPHFSEAITPQAGDLFLLCSDGLTDGAGEEGICSVLAMAEDAAVQADALVELALKGGGRDNITVVVIQVKE